MKKLLLIVGVLMIGITTRAQIKDESYKPKVKELMKVQSGQAAMIDQMIERTSERIPKAKQAAFKKDMHEEVEKLYDQIAQVYMEVYDKKEVDALLKFYNSPVGQKIQRKKPMITKKSAEIGQKFSQQVMPIVQKYMN